MRKLAKAFFLLFLLCSFSSSAVTVVVHPSNKTLINEQDIARIFLGKQAEFPGGGNAIPISLPENSEVTKSFITSVLKKTPPQLKSYWAKLVFTGQGDPPETLPSDKAVVDLVSSNENYIGFVSDGSHGPLRVVAKF